MSQQWYLSKDGQQSGPYSIEQLQQMIRTGQIDQADLVWNEIAAQWIPAWQVSSSSEERASSPGTSYPEISAYGQGYPASHAQTGKGKKGKGALLALLLLVAAIIGLGTFLGLHLFGPEREEAQAPATGLSSQEIFPYLGSWQGKLDGVLVYIRFAQGDKVTFVLPWFGDHTEGQYRTSGQNGDYSVELFNEAIREWNELFKLKSTGENAIAIIDPSSGEIETFTRITEGDFNEALARAEIEDPYLSFRIDIHTNLLSTFIVLESLMENPLYNAQWEEDLKVTLALLKVICEDIMQSSAPEQYLRSHTSLQSAASQYSLAVDNIIALDNKKAGHYFSSGDLYYDEANRQLQ